MINASQRFGNNDYSQSFIPVDFPLDDGAENGW
jgi:hypothetical protein